MIGCFFQTECFYVILKSLKKTNLTTSRSEDLELFQQLRRRHNGDISGKNAKCRQSPIFLDFFFFLVQLFLLHQLTGRQTQKKKADKDVTAQLESSQLNNLHAVCVERAGTGFLAM